MKFLIKVKTLIRTVQKHKHIIDLSGKAMFENERICAELIRNVHSIEKGLSLRNVRPCFGYAKIIEAKDFAKKLVETGDEKYNDIIWMFIHALDAYLIYHKSNTIIDEKLDDIQSVYDSLRSAAKPALDVEEKLGGYITLHPSRYSDAERAVMQRLFWDRHSIREFSREPVDMERLKEAIALACRCPSACNRQGYRVHVICKERVNIFEGWFDGVGGFVDEIDKIILITGKISTYRVSEEMQYIVSASVFAGYLTLALQAKDIGCCFIQRPVLRSIKWEEVSDALGISQDEQIICALGVGNYLDEYKAPVSHRLSLEQILKVYE